MPDPSNYESKDKFISACIPVVLKEGTAKDQKQAYAVCNSMWENRAAPSTQEAAVSTVSSDTEWAHQSALEDSSMSKTTQSEQELHSDDLMRVQRVVSVDVDNGTFGMTLATEGEASDGHILSIEGAHVPERMPMLISHWNEPTKAAGSIVKMRRHLSDNPKRLTAVGMMELDGEGEGASMRRDLMHMISQGHVNAVSVRWDFEWKDAIPRSKLPTDHPHFVDPEREPSNSPKRWGYFFKKWTPREGSIVALGADPGALIGRARQTTGKVAAFWQRMAEEARENPNFDGELAPKRGMTVAPDLPSLIAAFGARLRELGSDVEHLLKLGAPFDELMRVYEENKPVAPMDESIVRLMQRIDTLEDRLASAESNRTSLEDRLRAAEYGRVGGDPASPNSLSALVRQAVNEIRLERRAQMEKFRRELAARKGRVSEQEE